MRIGFFTDTYTPQINGVVTSIDLFREQLEARGHEVFVFAPTPAQRSDGTKVLRFKSVPFAFQREMRVAAPYSTEALRAVRRVRLDVVHSHDPFSIGLLGLAMAKAYRLPYVHTYHTLYPEYVHYIWDTRLTKEIAVRLSSDFCNRCDAVIAPSAKIAEALRRWGTKTRIEVIPTGVDLSEYQRREPEAIEGFRSSLGIPATERMLLFVGRLGREKNIELLIEALPLLRDSAARLVIVGGGPHREELEAVARREGVQERVVFAGYLPRERVALAYQAADLFVFSSITETQGLVLGEALASGLPVVAVHDTAVAEWVRHGANGMLAPPLPAPFAEAVDAALADEEGLRRMSEEARRIAEEGSIEHQVDRLLTVYAELSRRKLAYVRLRRHRVRRAGRRVVRATNHAIGSTRATLARGLRRAWRT